MSKRVIFQAAICIAICVAGLALTLRMLGDRYRAECHSISVEFTTLARNCPPNSRPGEWKQAIDEIANIVVQSSGRNVMQWPGPNACSSYAQLHSFHMDLKKMLSEKEILTQEDVLGIYDRVESISPYAGKCGRQFRKLFEDDLSRAFPSPFR